MSKFYTDEQGRVRYIGKKEKPVSNSRVSAIETAPLMGLKLQFITNEEGRVIPIGGPSAGGGSGGSGGSYKPYETEQEKELFDYASSLIPSRLMEDAGVKRILVTDQPEPGHPETLGKVENGVISVYPGDKKTVIHEIAHRIDYSRVGEEMMNRGIHTNLRDNPRMGNIGPMERASVFIEAVHSPKGSRANDWVNDAFPNLVKTYNDILKEMDY